MLRPWKYQAQLYKNHLLPRMGGERAGMGLEHRYTQGLQKGETHSHHCSFSAPWRPSGAGELQWVHSSSMEQESLGASRAMNTPGVTEMRGAGGNKQQALFEY